MRLRYWDWTRWRSNLRPCRFRTNRRLAPALGSIGSLILAVLFRLGFGFTRSTPPIGFYRRWLGYLKCSCGGSRGACLCFPKELPPRFDTAIKILGSSGRSNVGQRGAWRGHSLSFSVSRTGDSSTHESRSPPALWLRFLGRPRMGGYLEELPEEKNL